MAPNFGSIGTPLPRVLGRQHGQVEGAVPCEDQMRHLGFRV